MIGKLISYALRHRPVVLVLLGLLVLAGVQAFRELPVEAYPDVTNVQVQIITLFPGHAAEEVERLITIPVENEMNGIPKRSSLRSISLFGLSVVTIVFDDDASGDYVRNQAFQHLSAINFPAGARASISPDATPVGEIYRYSLQGPPGYPAVELKALQDWVVERQLRTVPGVVNIVGYGGPTKQYQVLIDPAKLKSYGVSLKQVFDALANGNRNAGGSYIEHGSEMYVVRGLGFVSDVADIAGIAVDTRAGRPIRISDLGQVVIGAQLRLGRVGKAAPGMPDQDDLVQGIVLLRKGENALQVLERVRAKVADINAHALPAGVHLVPHYDRTALIDRTLHSVRQNMIEGISLVLLVLILFLGLGEIRSALVVAAVVPLALLGAFLLLDLRHIPANLISMGAIDFGIIVDSAVVVIENLLRLRAEKRDRPMSSGQLIVEAGRQTGRPILFSKAILLTAFLPLYTMQRVEGKIFQPMALTLTFALIAGTLLALTIVPVLASFALKPAANKGDHESWLVRRLLALYRPLLDRALRHRRAVYAATLLSLVGTGLLASRLGSEFLPKLDEGSLWLHVNLPHSISPTEAGRLVTRVRGLLSSFREVKVIVSQLGRPDDGTDVGGFDAAELYIDLIPREQWSFPDREALVEAMNHKLAAIPGLDLQFSQVIEDNVNEAISGIKGELGIKVFGEDPIKLQALAERIAEVVRGVPGAADVGTEQLLGQPQVQITMDRRAIGRVGLSVSDVQSVVETALGGATATQVLEGERSFDLVVKLSPLAVTDLESIRKIPLFGGNGERLTLDQVSSVAVRAGFARVYREENARRIAVKFSVRGRDLGSLVTEAQQKVAAVPLPPGYRLEWTGSFENQQRALRRLLFIVPITLAAIYFLLFTAFDSGWVATLILLVVPFAAVGGIVALPLAGLNLSVSALVGFIALFGVAVQNGVLLVERIRELRRSGLPMDEAVSEGAASRLRPVVMTAAMAALGLLPAALSHAVGAETSRPFAVVIVGGLVTATVLTLFLLPVLYPRFEPETPATY